MNSRLQDLETLRDSLSQRLAHYHQHQRRAGGPPDPDFAEQASEAQNDEVVDILESEVRDQLLRIDHAMERLHAGVGDICERCQAAISAARLKAVPETTLCADCASGLE